MEILASILAAHVVQLGIAGGSGGIARWLFLLLSDRRLPPGQALATVALGLILGVFTGDPAVPAVNWAIGLIPGDFMVEADRLPGFTAFVIGAGGVGLAGFVIDVLKIRAKELIKSGAVDPTPPTKPGDVP